MTSLVQVAKRATDLDRSAAFFSLLLGSPTARFDPPGFVFFDADGVRLLLSPTAPPSMLYLRVTDLETVLARLEDAGVAVHSPPNAIFTHEDGVLGPAGTTEWQAFVLDPDGDPVGLVEHRPTD